MHVGNQCPDMHEYVSRDKAQYIKGLLERFPAVAILGPRQCGKSTLAKELLAQMHQVRYLDLERSVDLQQLQDPELFFSGATETLFCLDEVQLLPNLFPELRSVLDRGNRPGQLLLLGSASQELINHSAETLAGRIAYVQLGGLSVEELQRAQRASFLHAWVRGGFPPSILVSQGMQQFDATSDAHSFEWREQFVRTFLERDLPQLGFQSAAAIVRRFWQICAHCQGQLLNRSKIGESLGVDNKTVGRYLQILEQTFVVRLLPPYYSNMKKRLVKSPKLYIRDPGLLHCLLGIVSYNNLLGHVALGPSWEGFVIEEILNMLPSGWTGFFYRSSNGNEIDLILERGSRRLAIECKAASAPKVTRGFHAALKDLDIEHAWVVAPIEIAYPLTAQITVAGIMQAVPQIRDRLHCEPKQAQLL